MQVAVEAAVRRARDDAPVVLPSQAAVACRDEPGGCGCGQSRRRGPPHQLVDRRHDRRLLEGQRRKEPERNPPGDILRQDRADNQHPGLRRTRKASATARPRSATWCNISDITTAHSKGIAVRGHSRSSGRRPEPRWRSKIRRWRSRRRAPVARLRSRPAPPAAASTKQGARSGSGPCRSPRRQPDPTAGAVHASAHSSFPEDSQVVSDRSASCRSVVGRAPDPKHVLTCAWSQGPSTFRLRDGCTASIWTAPDGSRPIVWMIKAHPAEHRMATQAISTEVD
jgi:hypothetical protein